MSGAPDRFTIEVFDTLTSTNDSILALGSTGASEGSTHIARSQTRGRGRGSHRWWSPPGAGLWMSTLLRPTIERSLWPGVSLLAGAATRQALLELGVRDVQLYWPNDLEVRGRKIGGILGEVRSQGDRAWIALGIGINIDLTRPELRAALPEELRSQATSMVESGSPRTTDPVEIARVVLQNFWPFYQQFNIGRSIPELVGTRLAHTGEAVEVRPGGGKKPWKGRVEGLGERGELLVRPAPSSADADQPRRPTPPVKVIGGDVIYGNPERTERT